MRRKIEKFFYWNKTLLPPETTWETIKFPITFISHVFINETYRLWKFFFWSSEEKRTRHSRYDDEFFNEFIANCEKYLTPYFAKALDAFVKEPQRWLTEEQLEKMITRESTITFPYFSEEENELCRNPNL